MLEATIQSARELVHEIWDVEDARTDTPRAAKATACLADRLSNLGIVLLYAVLVAYGAATLLRMMPPHWVGSLSALRNKWWFWVGLALVGVTALRLGLGAAKMLKRWNVAGLLGSLLLFDFLFKAAPPLFGMAGFSPVDSFFRFLGKEDISEFVQKAMGL